MPPAPLCSINKKNVDQSVPCTRKEICQKQVAASAELGPWRGEIGKTLPKCTGIERQ